MRFVSNFKGLQTRTNNEGIQNFSLIDAFFEILQHINQKILILWLFNYSDNGANKNFEKTTLAHSSIVHLKIIFSKYFRKKMFQKNFFYKKK